MVCSLVIFVPGWRKEKSMTKDDAIQKIKDCLTETLSGAQIDIRLFTRNNNVKYVGVVISYKDGKFNMSPIIDITDFVNAVQQGTDEKYISKLIIDMYERERGTFKFEVSKQYIIDNAFPVVINYEANKEMLKDVPHSKYLDLAVIYKFNISPSGIDGCVTITYKILEQYSIPEDILKVVARKRGKHEACQLIKMSELLGLNDDIPDIYIFRTADNIYGARAIFNKSEVRKFGMDVYVIPSSIYEVLLVPFYLDPNGMRDVIKEVNDGGEVYPQDILSYNLYKYEYSTNNYIIID